MSLSTILKRVLSADYKALVTAGYLNNELKWTDAGRTAVLHAAAQESAIFTRLVEAANDKIARDEEEAAK